MVWMLEGMNDSSHSSRSTDGEKSAVLDSALSQGSIENQLISLQTKVRRLQEENTRLHDELRKERISHIKNKNTTRKLKALEKSYTALSRRATQAKETVDQTSQTTQVAQEQRELFRSMSSRLEEISSSSFEAFKSDVQSENEAQTGKECDDGLLEPFGQKPGRSSVRSFLSEIQFDLENECETKDPPQSTGLFGTLSRILPGMASKSRVTR
jgi:hypothetical protein